MYLCISLFCQTKYYNADQFPLLGKITEKTDTRYERLPGYLKETTREPVWNLGKNTSGLAIRFRTNSKTISAKWEVLKDFSMNHMTETGIKGLDLYALENDKWQFVNTARPTGKVNEQKIIENMTPAEREYMLFLPLYDGVVSLLIGVDSTATMNQPQELSPSVKNPIIVYGTSITQGGCATRPGMSYTNILSRKLNKEIINLGFSGNGQLDYGIAELMSTRTDASLFILDFIPNVKDAQIKDKLLPFIHIIRKSNPQTPILLVESVQFTHTFFDNNVKKSVSQKNNLLKEEFKKLQATGDKNIYYLSSQDLIGNDREATVDGVHLTDVGFLRLAEKIFQKIKKIKI